MEREEPTSEGAKLAGWRYAHSYPGESFVLRHSGIRYGRWRLIGHYDEIGFAVGQFKELREATIYGALAIWTAGHVNRFEQFEVESLIGKCREPGQ